MNKQTQTWVWMAVLGSSAVGAGCGDDSSSGPNAPTDVAEVAGAVRTKTTQFFVPPPTPAAVKQIAGLVKSRHVADAVKLAAMVATPRAAWFTSGSPEDVRKSVHQTMDAAACGDRLPVLVAYNLPFRDCAQYSAGGAADTAAYEAWIDGFARASATGKPTSSSSPTASASFRTTRPSWRGRLVQADRDGCHRRHGPRPRLERGRALPAAPGRGRDARREGPQRLVYIDGTHSDWLGVGEAAYRIHKAGFDPSTGAQRVKGFFLDVSNYQPTDQLVQFGTWVSQCLEAATSGASWAVGHFDYCPSQYDPATNYATVNYTPAFEATITAGLQNMLNGAVATMPFVIDTSRNGRGPLDAAPYAAAPYGQPASVIAGLNAGNWCNAPGAGAGLRPTASTGIPLVDAYLWIKEPGDSDGSCDIAGGARAWDYSAYDPWGVTGDAQNHFDPLWGMVDPTAGTWFPAQALQLAQLAVPPLF